MFDQGDTGTISDDGVGGGGARVSAPKHAYQRLHQRFLTRRRQQCAWDAEEARDLREALHMELWTHYGCISIIDYLEREHGIEPRTAFDRVRVSRELDALPVLEAELEVGTFTFSHVKELARVATRETEGAWIERAKGKHYRQIRELVAGHKKGDLPDDPVDPDLARRRIALDVAPKTEARYRAAVARIQQLMGGKLEDDDARFAAILDLAEAALAGMAGAKGGGGGGGDPTPHELPAGTGSDARAVVMSVAAPSPQIWVCNHCDRAWQDGGGLRAELSPEELDLALCNAIHMGAVDDPSARSKAAIPPRQKKRLLARDNHRCTVPGCGVSVYLDAHHLRHRKHGGTNADENVTTLCSGHHAAHHRGLLEITGQAPDRLVFRFRRSDEDDDVADAR